MQSLPGIRFVGIVDCYKLQPGLREAAMAGLTVAAHTSVEAVPFVNATVESVTEFSHGTPMETATLKFRTSLFLPIDIQLGFVVTDVCGNSWLIGAAEPPYPKDRASRRRPRRVGDRGQGRGATCAFALRLLTKMGAFVAPIFIMIDGEVDKVYRLSLFRYGLPP